MTEPTPADTSMRRLSLPMFGVVVLIYLAIIQGVGLVTLGLADLDDGKLLTVRQVLSAFWIPLGLALAFTFGVITFLRWWRPVLHDDQPVQRWVWFVPIAFVASIVIGTNYGQLADRGLAFTIVLLIATQFVGWGEEGMFRGIGVIALRQHGLTERRVALWSSLIFGAVHLTNAIGRGASAIPQALAVSCAGYFFYLIRRVSKGNVVNSVLHGLFDFSILTTAGIAVDPKVSVGAVAPILLYVVVGLVLIIRRRHILVAPPPGSA